MLSLHVVTDHVMGGSAATTVVRFTWQLSPVPNALVSLPWHLTFHLLIIFLTKAQVYDCFVCLFVLNLPHSTLLTALIFDWQYHPDKQSADAPAGTMEKCMQKFIEIDQAWKILGNEETKKMYDLQRHGRYLWCRDKAMDSSWKRSVQATPVEHFPAFASSYCRHCSSPHHCF